MFNENSLNTNSKAKIVYAGTSNQLKNCLPVTLLNSLPWFEFLEIEH